MTTDPKDYAPTNASLAIANEEAKAIAPVESLTPMQMAYQLAAQGIDPITVREMLTFGREIERERAEKQFNIAMAEAQSEMGVIFTNRKNDQTKSRYATYDALDRALRPIYSKNGFALSFDEADCPKPDYVRITCVVSHRDGYSRTYHRDMPADGKGAKGGDVMTKTHAAGAAASYGMRYILRGIFNVAVGEEDTDGNAPLQPISPEQLKVLLGLKDKVGADVSRFCKFFGIEAVPDLPANRFDEAVQMLGRKAQTNA